jgi:arylsulfatase A-like enzyme
MMPALVDAYASAVVASPPCVDRFDLVGGTVAEVEVGNPASCESLCVSNSSCTAFTFQRSDCSDHGEPVCKFGTGCCYLKRAGDMAPEQSGGLFPAINRCTCSSLVRVPAASNGSHIDALASRPTPPSSALNVLHILVDDLRPELPGPWGHPFVHAPHMAALSANGTTFRRAYCQISVCSPSRMSFMTGRRPTTTRTFNFMDHFRQSDCGVHAADARVVGAQLLLSSRVTDHQGGSGQCCTTCSLTRGCALWGWNATAAECALYSDGGGSGKIEPATARGLGRICGRKGRPRGWTSLPQAFLEAGWLTMGTGKVFHTEEGGTGPTAALRGIGMPPNQDPPSWTPGLSMSAVNQVAPMDDPAHSCDVRKASTTCAVDALADGTLLYNKTTSNDGEFEDRIIASDAVLKLRLARRLDGVPFYLAAGFRKPHLCFRFPAPMLKHYPAPGDVPLPTHRSLHESIPRIAHRDCEYSGGGPGGAPDAPLDDGITRRFRLYYAAAISWVDSQIGRVLAELHTLGFAPKTVVALHSDHGWSLGEQGEWQKVCVHSRARHLCMQARAQACTTLLRPPTPSHTFPHLPTHLLPTGSFPTLSSERAYLLRSSRRRSPRGTSRTPLSSSWTLCRRCSLSPLSRRSRRPRSSTVCLSCRC